MAAAAEAASSPGGAARESRARVLWSDLIRGIWNENPPFRLLIGMCPVLAITTAALNGLIMGLAVTFVLVCSDLLVSSLRRAIPNNVRIPVFVVVIATFVTVADMVLAGTVPAVHKALGLFIPLIVVNCLILGRAEAFAYRNTPDRALADALGMGIGETWGLTAVGALREALGYGTIFGYPVFGDAYVPIQIFTRPPGAFLTLGVIVGFIGWMNLRRTRRTGAGARLAVAEAAERDEEVCRCCGLAAHCMTVR